jgi:hypothetical protein
MKTLRKSLEDYLALRRGLGAKLHAEGVRRAQIRFFCRRTKIVIHHHPVGARLGTANLWAISHKTVDNGAWLCQVCIRL